MELLEDVHEVHGQVEIEVARGFVGQDQLRVGDHGPGDGHPLLLAAREPLARRIALGLKAQSADHGPHAPLQMGALHAAHLQGHGHVVEDSAVGQDLEVLKDHAHLAPQFRDVPFLQGVERHPGH